MFGVEVKPSSLKSPSSGGVSNLFGESFWLCDSVSDVSTDEWFSLVLGSEYVSLVFADDCGLVDCCAVNINNKMSLPAHVHIVCN